MHQMTQSSRFVRFGFVVATGIIALIGFVPTTANASHTDTQQTTQSSQQTAQLTRNGGDWCC